MATTEIEQKNEAQLMESVLLGGDLSKLNPAQRVSYYQRVCESVGLNPLTKPFGYITLNNKLVLYALKDATEQLRNNRHVSITQIEKEFTDDLYIVTAHATLPDGRTDISTGAVNIGTLKGDARANAIMKAETKAKRRVTLSICGMGFLDESEISSIPDARAVTVSEDGNVKPAHIPYEQAAAMTAKAQGGKDAKRLDACNQPQLEYLVEHSDKPELVDAALTVLEHDFNMPRPDDGIPF